MIYIGIDPGKNGGIFVKDGDDYVFYNIPLIGNEIDEQKLFNIFNIYKKLKCFAVIEDVHAIFGSAAGATFDFGYGCGLLSMCLVSCDIPFTKVQPKKWQSIMFEGVPLQLKTGTNKKDTKKMAEIAATRLFPTIDLKNTPRCKKAHDGKVDALLMLEYCTRNF